MLILSGYSRQHVMCDHFFAFHFCACSGVDGFFLLFLSLSLHSVCRLSIFFDFCLLVYRLSAVCLSFYFMSLSLPSVSRLSSLLFSVSLFTFCMPSIYPFILCLLVYLLSVVCLSIYFMSLGLPCVCRLSILLFSVS